MTAFKLKLREDRPATIEEHRKLRDEIEALRYQLRRMTDGYLIMCNNERDALVDEAEQILGDR